MDLMHLWIILRKILFVIIQMQKEDIHITINPFARWNLLVLANALNQIFDENSLK